ncbi:MAG: NAD(P)-dependent oxidoreductase [Thermoanaerobaculia bacterium]
MKETARSSTRRAAGSWTRRTGPTLRDGQAGGVTLDVFERELLPGAPDGAFDEALLTFHIGSYAAWRAGWVAMEPEAVSTTCWRRLHEARRRHRGSGFLGSHIADALSDRGLEVVVFDREPSRWLREGQRMEVGDLLDREALDRAFDGADVVYHLAALANLDSAHEAALATAQSNVLGTVEALEAARRAGVSRFVLASTVYVYSRAGGFYRVSKQACEAYVEEFQRQAGLDYTILRYGSLYGPRSDDSNGVHRLLHQAAREGRVELVGNPEDVREYVHVEDAAKLSVDAASAEFANQHLIVTGPHPTRLKDLLTMFSEILGREVRVDYLPPHPGGADVHYRVTPYSYTPRVGRKLTSSCFVDMGQGLLQLLETIHAGGDAPVVEGTDR